MEPRLLCAYDTSTTAHRSVQASSPACDIQVNPTQFGTDVPCRWRAFIQVERLDDRRGRPVRTVGVGQQGLPGKGLLGVPSVFGAPPARETAAVPEAAPAFKMGLLHQKTALV